MDQHSLILERKTSSTAAPVELQLVAEEKEMEILLKK
jgi:hypothetical protein